MTPKLIITIYYAPNNELHARHAKSVQIYSYFGVPTYIILSIVVLTKEAVRSPPAMTAVCGLLAPHEKNDIDCYYCLCITLTPFLSFFMCWAPRLKTLKDTSQNNATSGPL